MKTLLLLSLAIATTFSFQTPVHAQGGTLITEASALGYSDTPVTTAMS
jgi:hypothetical protein